MSISFRNSENGPLYQRPGNIYFVLIHRERLHSRQRRLCCLSRALFIDGFAFDSRLCFSSPQGRGSNGPQSDAGIGTDSILFGNDRSHADDREIDRLPQRKFQIPLLRALSEVWESEPP